MTNSNTRRDAHSAKVMLRMIDHRGKSAGLHASQRIEQMMAALDSVIMRLPEDPPDDMVQEFDRIVTTLRTADENVQAGNASSSRQSLDLAKARIERFAKLVEDYEPIQNG